MAGMSLSAAAANPLLCVQRQSRGESRTVGSVEARIWLEETYVFGLIGRREPEQTLLTLRPQKWPLLFTGSRGAVTRQAKNTRAKSHTPDTAGLQCNNAFIRYEYIVHSYGVFYVSNFAVHLLVDVTYIYSYLNDFNQGCTMYEVRVHCTHSTTWLPRGSR